MTNEQNHTRNPQSSDVYQAVEEMMAAFFAMSAENLDDSVAFNQIPNWDSLGHADLMARLAGILPAGLTAGAEAHLLSIGSIREYVRSGTITAARNTAGTAAFQRGLRGVLYAETRICEVDEQGGELRYCSVPVVDLVHTDFLDTVHLLIWGSLGGRDALRETRNTIWRGIRAAFATDFDPAADLVGAIAARPIPREESQEETALACVGYVDGLISRYLDSGLPDGGAESEYGLARLLLGPERIAALGEAGIRLLNACLVVQAEHGSNASTFVSRIVASCGAGLQYSVIAACSAFFGARHGGACAEAGELLQGVNSPSAATRMLESRLAQGGALPGFGHGVYKVRDPRTSVLRLVLEQAATKISDASHWLAVVDALEAAAQARYSRGLPSNVDVYLAAAYLTLGFKPAQFGYLFASSRVAGWVAHALEQAADGTLIRPRLAYRQTTPRRQM